MRRLASSLKKRTYTRCSEMVSTVKKSTASMLSACCWRRNARQRARRGSRRGRRLLRGGLPHRCWRHFQAKPVDLADDPLIAPARILPREAKDELADRAA